MALLDLDGLDDAQRHAVTTPSRLVAVIAGAGSGKTRVLTMRVAHRIHDGTADAAHTLVLTFTREAAGELRRRLPRLGLRERVEAGTFHAAMLGLLRQHRIDRGRMVPTVVQDRRRLLVDAIGRGSIDEVLAEVDWASARGIAPDRYAVEARRAGRHPSSGPNAIATAYTEYVALKRRRDVMDLDDLLSLAADLLEQDQAFADAVAWRYRHVLVDEAQDLNPLQHRIVDLLRRNHDDVFLVGDPAQAVYGFNGADPALLVDVSDRFPGIEVIRLGINHRCTPQVVATGSHVLRTGDIEPTAVDSSRPDGPTVAMRGCSDEGDEAGHIASFIAATDPGLVRHRDIAVLARTHAQLGPIAAALEAAGVPVAKRIDGPGSPYRGAIDAAIRCRSASALRAWAHDLLDSLDAADDRPPSAEHVEVATAVLEFLREQPLGDGAALRTWIATTDPFGVRAGGGVELSTFHASKGREWHTVVVSGVETGLVPHRSASTGAQRAEETRLLYVAVTRARERLLLTWAERRGGYRRRRSPLLEGFDPQPSRVEPPPASVTSLLESRRATVPDLVPQRLEDWRTHTARTLGVLPQQVCDDATLREIARLRPRSADELAQVHGVGPITARRWFPQLDGLLESASSEADGTQTPSRSTITGA